MESHDARFGVLAISEEIVPSVKEMGVKRAIALTVASARTINRRKGG